MREDGPTAVVGVPPSRRRSTGRAAFAYAVLGLALGLALVARVATIPGGGDEWTTGDWLVNYANGFVRRGLFGELFLALGPGGGPGALWVLLGIQLLCYGIVLAYAVQLLHRTDYEWSSIALVCGPAAVPFIGWDTSGGFGKEILVLVVLALLAWSRRPHRSDVGVLVLIGLAFGVWVVAVFSWEPTVLLFPAVVHLLWASDRRLLVPRRTAVAVFGAVAAVGGLLSLLAPGDVPTSVAICESVRANGFLGPELCTSQVAGGGTGGIAAIGWTWSQMTRGVAASFPLYLGFVPLAGLALLPTLLSAWFRKHVTWVPVIALALLPLFLLSPQYGRWIHLLAMTLMFCATAADVHGGASPSWSPLLAVLFVTLWGIPNSLAEDTWWEGYGLLMTVLRALIRTVSSILGVPVDPGLVGPGGL